MIWYPLFGKTPSAIRQWLRNAPAPTRTARQSPSLELAELETRILMSASPLVLDVALDGDPGDGTASHDTPVESGYSQFAMDGDAEFTAAEQPLSESSISDHPLDLLECSIDSTIRERHELVFVDASLPDYEQLLEDLLHRQSDVRQLDVILLDGQTDGVAQISRALEQYEHLDAIHILSHGTNSAVKLGNLWLDADGLHGYASDIALWGDALTSDADVLIYGCNLAGSDAGQALLEGLHALTGADVAASIDATGHEQLGGNWTLEYALGTIETADLLTAQGQASWFHILASATVRDDFSSGTFSGNSGTASWAGDWVEIGESDGPFHGHVCVTAERLTIDVSDDVGISRAVNLDGATQATLSYVWTIDGDDALEDTFLFIQVSDNGGLDWITLHTIDEHVDEGTYSSSYDITPYASSQTQVRLIVDGTGDGYFFLHNIQIAYETGVNTAPQLTLPGSLAVDEDTPLAIPGIVIADVDVDPQSSDQALLVTLSVEHGTLTLGDTTGLTFSVGDGTGDATLVFSGSLDDLNAALATLSYQGLPDYHGPDQLTVTVDDQGHAGSGEALSDSGTIDLTVHPVNDAPQLTLPGDLEVDEDTPLVIAGIVIADVDVDPQSGDQALLVTLSVEHGTLTLGDTTGLTFSVGDGTGDATLVFSGSLDDLNAALATLSYQGLPDYHGPDQLTVTVNDQGHVGSGEALSDSGTIALTVHPVNDAPVARPNAYSVRADEALVIDRPGVLINDTDVDGDVLTSVLLSPPSHGRLTLNPNGSFRYVPDPSYLGIVSFTYVAFDGEAYSEPVRVLIRIDNPTSPVDPGSNPLNPNANAGRLSDDGSKAPISGLPADLSALVAAELPFVDHGEKDGAALRTRQHEQSEGAQGADGRGVGNLDASSYGGAGWNELSSYRLTLRRDVEESQEMSLTPIEIVVTAPTVEPVTNSAMLVSEDLDDLSRLLNDDGLMQRLMIGSAVGLTTSLTVGYVLWTVRAGYLLTGLIAQMPAWKFVDPLFVLNSLDGNVVSSDGESLESIVQAGAVASASSERVT